MSEISETWQVRQVGRWRFSVTHVLDGWMSFSGPVLWGRRRAIRYATREALRHVDQPARVIANVRGRRDV